MTNAQANTNPPSRHPALVEAVRLDQWLWAARFFKTRSLAKKAIEAGQVRYEGERSKVSKSVAVGAKLRIRQGWEEKEITVLALSDQRLGAPCAQLLYQETEASQDKRADHRLARKAHAGMFTRQKPDTKQRRTLRDLKRADLG